MIQRSDISLNGILINLKLMRYTHTDNSVTVYYVLYINIISLIKIVTMLCCMLNCMLNLVHMMMVAPMRLKIINGGL